MSKPYAETKSATFKIVKGRELKEGDGLSDPYSDPVLYQKPHVITENDETR